uniref:Cmyb_C domain-containing protein n=1 Tax=Elaeophora elaphi TaxID=1147741 RepID=A0A0R3RX80_9BILA
MACKRLIEYLSSLQSRMPVESSSSTCDAADKTCKQTAVDESEDSGEEYPPSFSVLKMRTSLPVYSTAEQELSKETKDVSFVLKKKSSKKSSKKPCQKINHPMQMLCFFKETEIPIPQTYREIESTLNVVRALLKQYQEQTNVIVWEESDYRQLPSLSESEHTTDSAWNGSTDTSDRGSIFNFHTSSSFDLITPVQERPESFEAGIYSQKLEFSTPLSVSDEGIASKNSTH